MTLVYGNQKIVDELNKLDFENKRLREENEQLKKEHKIAIDEMITDYKNLEKENEQLRKEHQEMLEKYVLLKLKIGEVLNDE